MRALALFGLALALVYEYTGSLVASIALHTTQFAKPVLMFNGDSHIYRSDNPLSPSAMYA